MTKEERLEKAKEDNKVLKNIVVHYSEQLKEMNLSNFDFLYPVFVEAILNGTSRIIDDKQLVNSMVDSKKDDNFKVYSYLNTKEAMNEVNEIAKKAMRMNDDFIDSSEEISEEEMKNSLKKIWNIAFECSEKDNRENFIRSTIILKEATVQTNGGKPRPLTHY